MGVLDQIDEWGARRAAAGVATRQGPLALHGPVSEPFRWASVTKVLAATAVLVALEEGTVALDDPAGPPGSTVCHLLAHASGLPPGGDGPVVARPGERRIYSNPGFDALGEVVAAAARMPFAEYVAEAVVGPLALTGTVLDGSPASGARGPLVDLLALGRELLAPTLLAPETMALATEPAFPGLAGVLPGFGRQVPNDWGLGFELRDAKSPHWTGRRNSTRTFGHFGRSGTFIWVDPEAGLVCACLTDRDFGGWAAHAWPRLSDAVLEEFVPRSLGTPARA